MDRFWIVLQTIGSLVLIVLVLVFTYFVSRWYARRMGASASGRHVKVIDRTVLGANCSLVIVQAGGKFYMLGVSDKNMQLICELDDFDPALSATEPPAQFGPLFRQFLEKARQFGNKRDDGTEQ